MDEIKEKEAKLLSASIEGDFKLVKELRNQGVDPNCIHSSGRSPLLSFYPQIIDPNFTFY